MKPLRFLAGCLLIISIFSCQKEVDWASIPPPAGSPGTGGNPQANPSGITGGSNGTVLLSAVRKNNLDSVVATIEYNGADKFIKYTCFGKEKYDTFDINYKIYSTYERDANNRIIKFVGMNTLDTTIFGAVDSIRGTVHYPSASATDFDYVVTTSDMGLAIFTDSSLYTYSAGKVIRKTTYTYNDFLPGTVPELSSKQEFDYDVAGNVKEIRAYAADQLTGQLKLASKTTYTYDNKPNAYTFKNEGFLLTGIYYGPNNSLTAVNTNYGPPSQTTVISSAYNYNAQNYPMNGQMAASNPTRTFTLAFYYR
jgi:hypothetical protein